MVGLGGFEPPTSRLSGVRSNQTELQALMAFYNRLSVIGGPDRVRTDDLLDANQALSQLSYGPEYEPWNPSTPPKDLGTVGAAWKAG